MKIKITGLITLATASFLLSFTAVSCGLSGADLIEPVTISDTQQLLEIEKMTESIKTDAATAEKTSAAVTEQSTELPTELLTELPTKLLTEPPTEPPTELPTEPPTESPTELLTEASTEPPIENQEYDSSDACRLYVDTVLQNPELPTGCEVTALDTVLRYFGFDIDKLTLFDSYMPEGCEGEYTFDEAFIGNPRTYNGYGCFAPVVVTTAVNYFNCCGYNWTAYNLSGTSLSDLFIQIDAGNPVIVWASMGLTDISWQYRWTTPAGNEAWFPSGEHCMVLTGYDLTTGVVYAADPLKGSMEYSLSQFEYIYNRMNQQAVIVCPL